MHSNRNVIYYCLRYCNVSITIQTNNFCIQDRFLLPIPNENIKNYTIQRGFYFPFTIHLFFDCHRTVCTSGSEITGSTTSTAIRTVTRTTPRAGSFSRISVGWWYENTQMWSKRVKKSIWPTWKWILSSCSRKSESYTTCHSLFVYFILIKYVYSKQIVTLWTWFPK